jgi:hypothetical protein
MRDPLANLWQPMCTPRQRRDQGAGTGRFHAP